MHRSLRTILLAASAVVGLSCGEPTGVVDGWRAYAIPGRLVIQNLRDEPLYSLVFDESMAPLIDWIPVICDGCGKVGPQASLYIRVDSILGASPGSVVIVNTWRAVRGANDAAVPGDISTRRVRLDPGLIP